MPERPKPASYAPRYDIRPAISTITSKKPSNVVATKQTDICDIDPIQPVESSSSSSKKRNISLGGTVRRIDSQSSAQSMISSTDSKASNTTLSTTKKAPATYSSVHNKQTILKNDASVISTSTSKVKAKRDTEKNDGKMVKYKSLDDIPDGFEVDISPSPDKSMTPYDAEAYDNDPHQYLRPSPLSVSKPTQIPFHPQKRIENSDSDTDDELNEAYRKFVANRPSPKNILAVNGQERQDIAKSTNPRRESHGLPLFPAEQANQTSKMMYNIPGPSSSSTSVPAPPILPSEANYKYNPMQPRNESTYSQSVDSNGRNGPEKEKDKLFFSKEPRKVEYKPYSLEQYRLIKPKEYIEISNIKPDLNTDELVAKRANLQRVKEFARNLKKYNDTHIQTSSDKLPAPAQAIEIQKQVEKSASKRSKALEFAKQIPKPKLKESLSDDYRMVDPNQGEPDSHEKDIYGLTADESNKLSELELKHLEKKKQIEAIKKSLRMK